MDIRLAAATVTPHEFTRYVAVKASTLASLVVVIAVEDEKGLDLKGLVMLLV